MRNLLLSLVVSSLAALPTVALAESPWSVKIGLSQVSPKSSGGDDLEVKVSKEIGLTPSIQYKFSPNVVGEVLLAIPFEHDLEDPDNGEKIGSFKHLPPTFFC